MTAPHTTNRLEFGPIVLHEPPELAVDIPDQYVDVFMPAADGGRKEIGFLYYQHGMKGWSATESIQQALRAGESREFDSLPDLKRHLQALYVALRSGNPILSVCINTLYERAHVLEKQARLTHNLIIRDSMFTLRQSLDAYRAILELGDGEREIEHEF